MDQEKINDKQKMEDRLIKVTVLTGNIVKGLSENRMNYHLGGQLIRSGTSPALNYREARGAGSRRDFIHK